MIEVLAPHKCREDSQQQERHQSTCPRMETQDSSLEKQLEEMKKELEAEKLRHIHTIQLLQTSEAELFSCKRQLAEYQETQMEDIARRRTAALEYYRQEYERKQMIKVLQGGARDEPPLVTGTDTIDAPVPSTTTHMEVNHHQGASGHRYTASQTQDSDDEDDFLVCPHCNHKFTVVDTTAYLSHVDSCST